MFQKFNSIMAYLFDAFADSVYYPIFLFVIIFFSVTLGIYLIFKWLHKPVGHDIGTHL